jgi:hypothetical protein
MFTIGKFQVQEKLLAAVSALVFSAAFVSAAVGPAATGQANAPVQLASVSVDARA